MNLLNGLVRCYLVHFPVTEGKKRVLQLTKKLITPADPDQTVLTKHGFRLHLNLANPEQQRIYFYGEHDERYEAVLLKDVLQPGMVCWDIGANIGYYSCLFASLTGRGGKVVAFEPAQATRARLVQNIALNRLENVLVMPCAVGSVDGAARIHYRDAGLFEGTASLHETQDQTGSEVIAVSSIDTLVADLGAPDFLKIDVEGAQLEVWRGGKSFFSSHDPLVMAELRDSRNPEALKTIESTVRGFGYRIFSIRKGRRLSECQGLTPAGPRNFLLAKRDSKYEPILQSRAIA